MIGCTVQELGDRMTAEEFGWWRDAMQRDLLGWGAMSALLANIAAGIRNGPLKGPRGEGSMWSTDDYIEPDRWAPPPTVAADPKAGAWDAIKGFFGRWM